MHSCCDDVDMVWDDDGNFIYPEACDCICHHVSEDDL